jgi:hypothetical protein
MSNEKMREIYARLHDDMKHMRAEKEMKEAVIAAIVAPMSTASRISAMAGA